VPTLPVARSSVPCAKHEENMGVLQYFPQAFEREKRTPPSPELPTPLHYLSRASALLRGLTIYAVSSASRESRERGKVPLE
jgi:hypothetical protein